MANSKKKKLEDLPLEELSLLYNEALRISTDCERTYIACNSNAEQDLRKREISEFNNYADKVNKIIKERVREICG